MFDSIDGEIQAGSSPEEWNGLLAEWANNRQIPHENQAQIALLQAKLALKNGNKKKAEAFLKPWLREKSIPKELFRHYWIIQLADLFPHFNRFLP